MPHSAVAVVVAAGVVLVAGPSKAGDATSRYYSGSEGFLNPPVAGSIPAALTTERVREIPAFGQLVSNAVRGWGLGPETR